MSVYTDIYIAAALADLLDLGSLHYDLELLRLCLYMYDRLSAWDACFWIRYTLPCPAMMTFVHEHSHAYAFTSLQPTCPDIPNI